jgi:hypothetical protein
MPYFECGKTPRFPHEIITPIESHWTDGGRGTTNFDKKDESIYRTAIAACPQLKLAIRKYPMYGENGCLSDCMIKDYYCLIQAGEKRDDLSKFWAVYHAIKSAQS